MTSPEQGSELAALGERSWQMSRRLGAMSLEHRFMALAEEVGELGRSLLGRAGVKSCSDDEPLDVSFAGVLFELLVLARECNVDIVVGYENGLQLLAERHGSSD